MLTECGNIPTPELVEQTRAELRLDKPLLSNILNGHLMLLYGEVGKSYSLRVPVVE